MRDRAWHSGSGSESRSRPRTQAAAHDAAGRLTAEEEGGDRLAAAGFADESQCLGGRQVEADMVDRGHGRTGTFEDDGQVLNIQQRCHHSAP